MKMKYLPRSLSTFTLVLAACGFSVASLQADPPASPPLPPPPPPPPLPPPPPPGHSMAVSGAVSAAVSGGVAVSGTGHRQGQRSWSGAPSLSPPLQPSSAAVTVRGGSEHGYDHYVISGTIRGGLQGQRQTLGAAGIQGYGRTIVRGVGSATNDPHSPVAPPPTLSNGTVTGGGNANHGYERYVISGTLEGGWQWQQQAPETAGTRSDGRGNAQGAGTGASGSHFLGSLNRFTSRVHTWWQSRNALWIGNRGHGTRATETGNHSRNDGGRPGK